MFLRAANATIDAFHFDVQQEAPDAEDADVENDDDDDDDSVADAAEAEAAAVDPVQATQQSQNDGDDESESGDDDEVEGAVPRKGKKSKKGKGGQDDATPAPQPQQPAVNSRVLDKQEIHKRLNLAPRSVSGLLSRVVLPILDRLSLTRTEQIKDKDGAVDPLAAVAYVKVLRLVSESAFELELPKFLIRVANVLKSKRQLDRDAAKLTLVKVSETVGVRFLRGILQVVRQALQTGFAAHVLGHVVHAVMIAMSQSLQPVVYPERDVNPSTEETMTESEPLGDGSLALVASLPLLLEVIMEDVLGTTAESRQHDSGYVSKVRCCS